MDVLGKSNDLLGKSYTVGFCSYMVGMSGFWPRFLALDRRTGGAEIQFYSTTETEKYSFAVLVLS